MLFLVCKRNSPGCQSFHCWEMGEGITKTKQSTFAKICHHTIGTPFCFSIVFFFSILHENSSTLSFSQELTDKNRKAQWIPVLQLSSEAKGKVWGQTEAGACSVPDLILNLGVHPNFWRKWRMQWGWNISQNAWMELQIEDYLDSVAIRMHKKSHRRNANFSGLGLYPDLEI